MDVTIMEVQDIIKIKDVEVGKPDAKDEVIYSKSLEEFCERIILPPNFMIDNILYRDKFYIVGNKGVGKTALLFYISYLLKKKETAAECSMILFKTDIPDAQRARMEATEKIRLNNMNISKDELKYINDFSRLWTLVIYKKIVNDNKENEIFEKDTNWKAFEGLIERLDEKQADILGFATKIQKNNIYFDNEQDSYIAEKIEYPEDESALPLQFFYEAIEQASKLFCSLNLKKKKYFIFIDELEAYHRSNDIYIRDLTMIRDLIIVTKRINAMLKVHNINSIKIILSVRSEVIASISREIPGFELNKDLVGFSERISWSGAKADFVRHPLLAIWIKRIQESLNQKGFSYTSSEIYFHMFEEFVGMNRIMDYILERTWNKPRDIVRFMSCINDQAGENQYRYDAKSFECCMEEYSRQSKEELVEELGAIYSNQQIEKIFISLTAYKKHFSKMELLSRLEECILKYYPELDSEKLVSDLYRVGVLGLINFNTKQELWGYRGQRNAEGDEWRFLVHRGLWRNLELDSEAYEGILCVDIIRNNYSCLIEGYENNYLSLSFVHKGKTLNGIAHISNIGKPVDKEKCVGERVNAFVIDYDLRKRTWILSCFAKKVL